MRAYLNGAFFNSFGQDKARIAETRITTNNNPWFGTQGGNAANNRIFLLTLEEVAQYFGDSEQLLKNQPKDAYVINDQHNAARIAAYESGKASWWWLRSPGYSSAYAASVHRNGGVVVSGNSVSNYSGGVRPALWLKL